MAQRARTTPRKQAQQSRSQSTVDAILRATARILVKEGYDHASTNKIAIAAGVSVGSLYQYFPSKEALVAALVEKHMAEMAEVIRREFIHLAAAPLEEAAHRAVKLMVEAHAIDPKLHKVLVEQVPRVGRLEQLEASEREFTELTRAYLEMHKHEIAVKNLDLAAFMIVRTVEALTHQAVLSQPEILGPAFTREVADMIVRYLRG